jgi:DNA repair protein RadD
LDDGKRKKKSKAERREPKPFKCYRCKHIHPPRPICPACGFEYPVRSAIEVMDGELIALGAGGAASQGDRQRIFSELLHVARSRGYNDGWAAHKYRELFGAWPRGLNDQAMVEPSSALLRWVLSRQIAWAKRKVG